jgi:nicotinamide riboside transporter PnuC
MLKLKRQHKQLKVMFYKIILIITDKRYQKTHNRSEDACISSKENISWIKFFDFKVINVLFFFVIVFAAGSRVK